MKNALLLAAVILIVGIAWKTSSPYGGNTFPATGNVGINTLTPAYPLEVAGMSRFDSIIKVGGGPTMNYGEIDMCRQDGNVMTRILSNASQTAIYGNGALTISPGGSTPETFFGGRNLFGGAVDDGVDYVQVKGPMAVDSFKAAGNTGDVWTKDATGYFKAAAPTGGSGLNGIYSPTLTAIANCGSLTGSIYYSVNGKTVTINFSGGYIPTSNNLPTSFSVSIPNLGTFLNMLTGPLTANGQSGGAGYVAGIATWNPATSKIDCKFITGASGWAGSSGNVQFTIMYELQ